MHPVIFRFGKLVIYSYSMMVVVAFCLMILYGVLEARRIKEDPEKVIDIGILMFLASMLGARLLNCIINWRVYIHDPLRVFKLWEGGLVYYGGLAGAFVAGTIYIWSKRLNWNRWADLVAPTAMIADAVGRVGCFLNGCCYGKPAPSWLPLKVTYPRAMMPLELSGVPLYPAPIYESIAAAAIFVLLAWKAAHKKFEGEIFWLMIWLYAIVRFFLEFLRADERGGIDALHMSTSQIIGAALFMLSGAFLVKGYLKPAAKKAGT